MSRGRGRGGGGPQGGARGGRGGGGYGKGNQSWPGEGRTLNEGEPSGRGSFRGGRGRGRGGPMRGIGLRAAGQNAVGYNYSTPLESGQQSPEEQAMDLVPDEDDVILETHRKYTHVVKPHLEQQEAPQLFTPTNEAGIAIMLPPSVSNLLARAPSNVVAMERAQRAMEGQVAGLIPTGPKSAHVHRMYGTLDAVHIRNKNRQQQSQQSPFGQPLPVSSSSNDKKKKGKFDRPLENSSGDPCLAGIPNRTLPKGFNDKFNHLGKGAAGNLQVPIKFEKASGEWKDGAWIRSSDGKKVATKESVEEAVVHESQQASDPFERASGAGLGFRSSKQAAPLQDDTWAMEREQHDEENDPIAALLKAYPGSTELQGDDEGHGENFYESPLSVTHVNGSARLTSLPAKLVPEDEEERAIEDDAAIAVDRTSESPMEDASSNDEDVILIPQAHGMETAAQTMESDSDEERQLNAIIQQNSRDLQGAEVIQEQQSGFYVDLTGEAEGDKNEIIQYETTELSALGEHVATETGDAAIIDKDSSEEDEVNLTQRQPRGQGKKARNAAKKARRRARKGVNVNSEPAVAREGDSDLDWGSDGPPVKFKKQADQESFVQGGPMEQLNLNSLSRPNDKDEEEEMLVIALTNSVEQQKAPKSDKKPLGTQSVKDAILADYMENAMGANDTDEEASGDGVTEQRDDKKIDQKTDLDRMLQFMNGMDGQRKGKEVTLEDIAFEQQLQEENEWMTESEEDEEEGSDNDNERKFDAALKKEERRAMPDESEDESGEEDSASEESESGHRKPGAETWSETDSDSDDEDDAFNRHFSWADADEAFIDRLDKFAKANDAVLKGRDRKARNLLFKMIESGNFGLGDENDMVIDNDDPVFGLGALQPVKKGKKNQKTWGADHLWAEQLQSQWEKDRAQKADNKRKRAAERAAAAENPFHATQIKKGTKKMAKKAARAERRANRNAGSSNRGNRINGDDDDGDEEDVDSRDHMSRHAVNLYELDKQIQGFLRDHGKTTLSLAPMDKRSRAQVHLLANCYTLISKSKGNGTKRFPTLIKNSRSGFNVNFQKVNSILRGSQGSFGSGYRGSDKDRIKVKDRASGVGAHVPKNQEGAAVGFGADRIGEENVGHRLLTMMGWSEGSGVGLTKGAAEPVGATIKVTKSGLGF